MSSGGERMSRLNDLRQQWQESPSNPKNWTEKDCLQDIYNTRIAFGFLAGILLSIIFQYSIGIDLFFKVVYALMYCIFIVALILMDRNSIRRFKEKYPQQEVFE